MHIITQNGMGGGALEPLEMKARSTLSIAIPIRTNRTNGSIKARTTRMGTRMTPQMIIKVPKQVCDNVSFACRREAIIRSLHDSRPLGIREPKFSRGAPETVGRRGRKSQSAGTAGAIAVAILDGANALALLVRYARIEQPPPPY
ncbi:MAG TPA: hypothetical protein PKE27_08755 [Povalibacter sp.]|nr:hypothetical protein [Povalibacter sp.]